VNVEDTTSEPPQLPNTADAPSPPTQPSLWAGGCAGGMVGLFGLVGVVAVLAGAGFASVWGVFRWVTTPSPVVVTSTGPTITQIEALGDLTVMKVSVVDILMAEGNGYKGSWMVKGDALISVDCREATIHDVDRDGMTATIVLPAPRAVQPRVDHSRTMEWSVEKMVWWNPFTGDESPMRREAMRQAQRLVEHAVQKDTVLDQSRANAELLMANLYRLVGWDVTVKWADLTTPEQSAK